MAQQPNYYDAQFADRINQISKPQATPPSSGSGLGWKGAGGGIGILVFIVIRVLLAATRTSSSSYSPQQYYTPPTVTFPAKQFDANEQPFNRVDPNDNQKLDELLRQINERNAKPAPAPPIDAPLDEDRN